jgi:hypothetical protein
LHSHLEDPERDMLVRFRSSPYGGVSHSHANQNGFQILLGGKAMTAPGGERYPHHGSPFHREYTQTPPAHNALLIDGESQVYGGAPHTGRMADQEAHDDLAWVCGEAAAAYRAPLLRCRRHVLLLRPRILLVVDDVAAEEPVTAQWLLHTYARPVGVLSSGKLLVEDDGYRMQVRLFASEPLDLTLDHTWPVAPAKGYEHTDLPPEPARRWHLQAATRGKHRALRMAAVLTCALPHEELPELDLVAHVDRVAGTIRSGPGSTGLAVQWNGTPLVRIGERTFGGD